MRWTIRQLNELRFYADEGLSVRRTAPVMGLSVGQVTQAAHRYAVKFKGSSGAPFDNHNATRSSVVSSEQKRTRHRDRMRRWRRDRRLADAAD